MALFKETPTTELKIGGMHCDNCVSRVKDALEAVDGVTSVEVSLEKEMARVHGCAQNEDLLHAVRALNFTADVV